MVELCNKIRLSLAGWHGDRRTLINADVAKISEKKKLNASVTFFVMV